MKIDRRFGDHFVLMDSALWCGCLIYITVLGSWPLIWTIRAPYKLRTETSLLLSLQDLDVANSDISSFFFLWTDISSFYLHSRSWMMRKLRHAMAIIFISSSPLSLAFLDRIAFLCLLLYSVDLYTFCCLALSLSSWKVISLSFSRLLFHTESSCTWLR